MKIALDYDDTYTRDPVLWNVFVKQALYRGHDVRFVTFRSDNGNNQDIDESSTHLSIPVLYTGGQRKRKYCYEQGFMVQVWIDDMPEIIVEDHGDLLYPENLIKLALEDN